MNEKLILTIIDKFSAGCIGELELDDGTTRLILKKERISSVEGKHSADAGVTHCEAEKREEAKPGTSVRLGISAGMAETADNIDKITSPIVATYYSAPSPDAPPFVKPGAKVKAGQTLCILEAMKMMNHLEADFDGTVIAILVKNGEMVEYGQPLFEIQRL